MSKKLTDREWRAAWDEHLKAIYHLLGALDETVTVKDEMDARRDLAEEREHGDWLLSTTPDRYRRHGSLPGVWHPDRGTQAGVRGVKL